jgi:hypothetical protein
MRHPLTSQTSSDAGYCYLVCFKQCDMAPVIQDHGFDRDFQPHLLPKDGSDGAVSLILLPPFPVATGLHGMSCLRFQKCLSCVEKHSNSVWSRATHIDSGCSEIRGGRSRPPTS